MATRSQWTGEHRHGHEMKEASASQASRTLFVLVFWSLLTALVGGQEGLPPEFLRARALVVRFLAVSGDPAPQVTRQSAAKADLSKAAEAGSPSGPISKANPGAVAPSSSQASIPPASVRARSIQMPRWTSSSHRYTVSGSPVGIRLASENLVVVVQVTPYDHGDDGLVVVAQGQVWTRQENGEIAYRNVFETLQVSYGERVFFYPLGMTPDGTSPIRLEIAVDHFGDPPSLPEDGSERSASQASGTNRLAPNASEAAQPAKRGP